MRGPSTGCFQTPVCTVRPRHATSRGSPTLTDTSAPTAGEGFADAGAGRLGAHGFQYAYEAVATPRPRAVADRSIPGRQGTFRRVITHDRRA